MLVFQASDSVQTSSTKQPTSMQQEKYNFGSLFSRINDLNNKIGIDKQFNPESKNLQIQLSGIVKELDERFGFKLDNHSLDVRTEGKNIDINYFGGEWKSGINMTEIMKITITPENKATRTTTFRDINKPDIVKTETFELRKPQLP